MAASPAEVASERISNTVLGGATGWTIFIGTMEASPNQVACFYDTGGANPNPRYLLDYQSFMVHVRGNPKEYGVAYAKAKQIKSQLLGIDSQTIGSDRWVSVQMAGDIMFIHYDDKERPIFSLNFRTIIEPAFDSLDQRESLP